MVPDQLRLSDGWVRCGHCSQVFDASEHLQVTGEPSAAPAPLACSAAEAGLILDGDTNESAAPQEADVAVMAVQHPEPPPTQPGITAHAPADAADVANAAWVASTEPALPIPVGSQPELEQLELASELAPIKPEQSTAYRGRSVAARRLLHGDTDGAAPLAEIGATEAPAEPADPINRGGAAASNAHLLWQAACIDDAVEEELPSAVPMVESLAKTTVKMPAKPAAITSLAAPTTSPPEPSAQPSRPAEPTVAVMNPQSPFFDGTGFPLADARAQRISRWRVIAGISVLTFLLLFQFMLRERDRIVVAVPGASPVVLALCRLAHCGSVTRRQIDAVVIEGSAFNHHNDRYQFSIELRNSAAVAVAMPAFELTLTDLQDRTVVRRVLQPAEIGAPAELEAGARWNGGVAMAFTSPTDGRAPMEVSGYRLLAFYP